MDNKALKKKTYSKPYSFCNNQWRKSCNFKITLILLYFVKKKEIVDKNHAIVTKTTKNVTSGSRPCPYMYLHNEQTSL
jgi:hypothetical protein